MLNYKMEQDVGIEPTLRGNPRGLDLRANPARSTTSLRSVAQGKLLPCPRPRRCWYCGLSSENGCFDDYDFHFEHEVLHDSRVIQELLEFGCRRRTVLLAQISQTADVQRLILQLLGRPIWFHSRLSNSETVRTLVSSTSRVKQLQNRFGSIRSRFKSIGSEPAGCGGGYK
jgi:hypothetical protein